MPTNNQHQTQQQGQSSTQSKSQQQSNTSNSGSASMDSIRHRNLLGGSGRATHENDRTHEFSPEETREAGKNNHDQDHGGDEDQDDIGTHTRGRTGRQHAEAGRQSHKNDTGSASEKH